MKFARCFIKGSDNPLRWIDFPLPDDPQAFMGFVTTVRLNGAAYPVPGLQAFIPFDEIKFMIYVDAGAPMLGNIVHEGTGTTQ
jgi:hypothetical protein